MRVCVAGGDDIRLRFRAHALARSLRAHALVALGGITGRDDIRLREPGSASIYVCPYYWRVVREGGTTSAAMLVVSLALSLSLALSTSSAM